MKTRMESLCGHIYKLQVMDVSLNGPPYIYGDNMSVIHNNQRPEPNTNKKTTPFAIMQCGSPLQWLNLSLLTFLLSLTLIIFWQRHFLGGRKGVWCKGCCMMSLINLFIFYVSISTQQSHWNKVDGTV